MLGLELAVPVLPNSSVPVSHPEVERQAKAFVSQAQACMADVPALKLAAGKSGGSEVEHEGTCAFVLYTSCYLLVSGQRLAFSIAFLALKSLSVCVFDALVNVRKAPVLWAGFFP